MRRDFSNIDIFAGCTASTTAPATNNEVWETAEHINVKPVYTADDLKEALKERLPEKLWDVNFRALDYAKQA